MYLKKENKKMPSRTSLSPEKKENFLMEDALISIQIQYTVLLKCMYAKDLKLLQTLNLDQLLLTLHLALKLNVQF